MRILLKLSIVIFSLSLFLSSRSTWSENATQKEMTKEEIAQKERKRLEYVKEYERSGRGKRKKINEYIHQFAVKNRFDSRVNHFDVTADWNRNEIHLKGVVMNEGMKEGVIDLLEKLQFKSINGDDLMVLPDPALGENLWALVSVPILIQYNDFQVKDNSSRLGDYNYGTALQLLMKSQDGKYAYTTSPEGYLGWVSLDEIMEVPLQVWQSRKRGPYAFMKEAVVVDLTTGKVETGNWNPNENLPKTKVAFPKSSLQLLNDKREIILVDGRTVAIDESLFTWQNPATNPMRKTVVEYAKSFLGTQYVWGGRTNMGIDCSGLTQAAYEAIGISIARDSSQQVISGEIVGTRFNFEAALPGDLIYFVRRPGRVYHTAVYLGDGKFIHAVPNPGVLISSFNPEGPDYRGHLPGRISSIRRLIR